MAKNSSGVGYGNPPVHSRFKPGQSGNKKGRPKATPNMADMVYKELSEVQTIEKDGEKVRITVLQMVVKQLIRSAAKSNARALLTVIPLYEEGLARRVKADQAAIVAKIPRPDLSKMSQEELTQLYFETLRIDRTRT